MQKRNGSKEAGVLLATSVLALVLIAPMGASAALDGGSTMAVKSTHSDGFYGHAGMVVPPKDSSSSPEESMEAKFYLMRVSGLAAGVPYTMRSYDKNGALMSTSGNTTDGDGAASYSFLRTRNKTPDVLPVSLEIDIEGKTYRIGYTKPTSKKNDVLALSARLEGGKLVQQF